MRLHNGVKGFYKLEAVNAKTGKVRLLADWFPNLITNLGLDYMASNSNYLRYCYVGSGSATPAITDTGLNTHVATFDAGLYNTGLTLNTQNFNNATPYYRYNIRTYRFGAGVAAGNLSEVGVGWGASHSGYTFSRALILDTYGNPTTITVLSDEYLDVTYEFRMYPLETDVTGNVTLTGNKGATYAYTIRPGNIAYLPNESAQYFPIAINYIYGGSTTLDPKCSDAAIGIITAALAGSDCTQTWAAYTNGTYYRDTTITMGLTVGNFGTGIQKLGLYIAACGWQVGFNPVIAKTSSDIVTITLRISWARV